MAHPFETELEELAAKFARDLSHEVTALILRRLGIEKSVTKPSVSGGARAASAKPSRGAPAGKRGAAAAVKPAKAQQGAKPSRRARATPEERTASLTAVERIVAASEGLSAGDIERKSGLSGAVVASALKTLKKEGRIYMGGTKRFARYAVTQAAADKASQNARGGSSA